MISLLSGNAGVSALVSARIYKSELPRGFVLPALAVHRSGSGSKDYTFSGPTPIREDQIQIDAYGGDAETCQQVAEAVRIALIGYTGTLPDGTVVVACYLERDMDMPFLPHADQKGLANRSLLGFKMVSQGQ